MKLVQAQLFNFITICQEEPNEVTVQNRQIEPKEMAPTIMKFGFRVLLCLDANTL